MFVKRIGAAYLGDDPVWMLSVDQRDPQWWGREAAFYESGLARRGWSDDCSPPECFGLDAREDEIDLWLEWVERVPLTSGEYGSAVKGLARWQAAQLDYDGPVLSHGWLAQHVSRRKLDNAVTLAHPGWAALLAAGLSKDARIWAQGRVVDTAHVAAAIRGFPELPTHHDFQGMNIGSSGSHITILDWATVGWGPVGHDVGNLVVDRSADGDVDPRELWSTLLGEYGNELRMSGIDIDQEVIERSAEASSAVRMGWLLDFLLDGTCGDDTSILMPLIPVANLLTEFAMSVANSS